MSESLPPHELKHYRLPCPSLFSRICLNLCPLSQWCHHTISSSVTLFSSCLSLSQDQCVSSESDLRRRWSMYWSFSSSISPSNVYSGLIILRIDCFNLLPVQETLKSLLQHYNSKAAILRCSAFFVVQLSHPYLTIQKTIALTIQTFVRNISISTFYYFVR